MKTTIKESFALRPARASQILEEFKLLLDVECESAGDEVDAYRWDYLRKETLSKYVGPDTDSADVRRDRAISKWLGVELRNSRTNIRLYSRDTSFYSRVTKTRVWSEDILEYARQLILRVIGSEPDRESMGNFSSGASTSLRRSLGNAARKFTVKADVTEQAWPFVLPQLVECHTWMTYNGMLTQPRFVKGNILFTVPKTTQIDRVAAKEPDLNMWAQKRLGDCIRKSLKRFGIDLNDQSINSALAKRGSQTGQLATLDLSSASDSMTTALVGRLLPPGWFVELNALRSAHTLIDDVWHENQMFSSMGNGFTFELESLLFYSIARAVCALTGVRGRVSVYGDDIIVPSPVASLLRDVLGYCGFVVNPKKSHWTSDDHFRESCGGHYYAGYDVKPFYIKSPIKTQGDLIHFLNSFRQWIDVEPFCHTISPLVRETWWRWAKNVDQRAWGGRDLTSKQRLVTPHRPRKAWIEVRKKEDRLTVKLQTGLYLQTLRVLTGRASDMSYESTSADLTDGSGKFVLRNQRMTYWEKVTYPYPRW